MGLELGWEAGASGLELVVVLAAAGAGLPRHLGVREAAAVPHEAGAAAPEVHVGAGLRGGRKSVREWNRAGG